MLIYILILQQVFDKCKIELAGRLSDACKATAIQKGKVSHFLQFVSML